nr:retron system putative HNH endonuclease [Rugamonas sp. CCM 8940]
MCQSHANPPQTAGEASSRWRGFAHKPSLMESLLDEQYHLCCYSELPADQEGLGFHIEHVENKSQNPPRTFDYANLAASALASENDLRAFKARGDELFGGHAPGKQAACDMVRFVSCHQADCHRFFAYVSDGRALPAKALDARETDRAQYTIDILNLNSPYLVTLRRKWWDELDELFQEHAEKGWSLIDLAAIDLVPVNRRLNRFFSQTRQFFGPLAEQALRQHAARLV